MARVAGGKKFDKMNVARVYFGNWLRDYSQAIDVGTVKYVSAEAIRILLWVLGFMTFGYGTKEFEVTLDRLGCYRPEDHIDNPKDYADNEDARQYYRQLRAPVNERTELAIDEETGMKNYIANERVGITTSAGHVRKLFAECIELGRQYGRSENEADLHEALRLLGTALHCLEDWSAHSNYTELALIEMGEEEVFPHVGRNCQINLPGARGPVYPIVTGTFGGVDFLHSVMGEINDKATQSEIQQLEDTMTNGEKNDTSFLKDILAKIPEGIFGGEDEGSKADELRENSMNAQMNQTRINPREPEAFTQQMDEYVRSIYPIVEWHDETMQKISKAINSTPILPDLIEKLEERINIFVFGLLAPFVLPIINQLKNELNTGSSEIIQSSKDKQLIVFYEDDCSDPTHSMLSKDHFSNILNEPAGKIASEVVKWVVPQIMEAWDDESADVDRICSRVINGTFHHPAHRQHGDDGAQEGRERMFNVVSQWWNGLSSSAKREMREKLSREGVQNGQNHKEGVEDCGHGCGKPIGMASNTKGQGAGGGMISDLVGALGGGEEASNAGRQYGRPDASQLSEHVEQVAAKAAGGGALGGIVGGIAGALSGGLLSGAFGDQDKEKKKKEYDTADGGHTTQYSEYGRNQDAYGQATYKETTYGSGEGRSEYNRYEETSDNRPSQGYQERTERRQRDDGGFETTTSYTAQRGSEVETNTWSHGVRGDGEEYETERHKEKYTSHKQYGRKKDSDDEDEDDNDDEDDEYKREKKERKRREKREKKEREREQGSYGGGYNQNENRRSGGYQQESSYGEQRQEYGSGGYGQQQEYGSGRQGYESRNEYGHGGMPGALQSEGGYGGGYEQQRQEYGSGGYGGQQQYGGGGGYERQERRGSNDDDDHHRRRRSGSRGGSRERRGSNEYRRY